MNRLASRTLILSLFFASNDAFAPVNSMKKVPFFVNVVEPATSSTAVLDSNTGSSSAAMDTEVPTEAVTPQVDATEQAATPPAPKKKKIAAKKDADGLFAPAVLLTKDILGDTELNKLRAKIIGLHSDVIGKFTSTAQSEFGNQVLKVLFTLADKDGDGTIDEKELKVALDAMGFDFLKEKQIAGIFKRADGDENGRLDFDEWQQAAPKTLKAALIKLAKKNGHDLGFLA